MFGAIILIVRKPVSDGSLRRLGRAFKALLRHQPFNVVQAAVEAFSQNIVPGMPCAIGAITVMEAPTD